MYCTLLHLDVLKLSLQYNFVGKLLGPGGKTLQQLQEDTFTKMAILGKGVMRDKTKVSDGKRFQV